MEKEFEALDNLEKVIEEITINNADLRNTLKTSVLITTIRQALTELKQIKEAKPNDAMEWQVKQALDELYDVAGNIKNLNTEYNTIKNYILKTQEFEKVSAIFKTKPFNMIYFVDEIRPDIYKNSYADYKNWFVFMGGRVNNLLTKEEFELLKRWSEKCH